MVAMRAMELDLLLISLWLLFLRLIENIRQTEHGHNREHFIWQSNSTDVSNTLASGGSMGK